MGIRTIGAFTAATPPIIVAQSPSLLSVVRNLKGQWVTTTTADRGTPSRSVTLCQVAQAITASHLRMANAVVTGATTRQLRALEEAAGGGASILQDLAMSFCILDEDSTSDDEGYVAACGSIALVGGPGYQWVWQDGGFQNAIVYNGLGDLSVFLQPDRGQDASECIVLCSERKVLPFAGSDLTATGVVQVDDFEKRITIGQEGGGGAASALTDYPLDVVVLSTRRNDEGPRSKLLAAGVFDTTTGAPVASWQTADFAAAAITSAGVGLPILHFLANRGKDNREMAAIFRVMSPLAASGLIGCTMHSGGSDDVTKPASLVQEQGGGAASILVDNTAMAVAIFGSL